jgi:hypothetical protein
VYDHPGLLKNQTPFFSKKYNEPVIPTISKINRKLKFLPVFSNPGVTIRNGFPVLPGKWRRTLNRFNKHSG